MSLLLKSIRLSSPRDTLLLNFATSPQMSSPGSKCSGINHPTYPVGWGQENRPGSQQQQKKSRQKKPKGAEWLLPLSQRPTRRAPGASPQLHQPPDPPNPPARAPLQLHRSLEEPRPSRATLQLHRLPSLPPATSITPSHPPPEALQLHGPPAPPPQLHRPREARRAEARRAPAPHPRGGRPAAAAAPRAPRWPRGPPRSCTAPRRRAPTARTTQTNSVPPRRDPPAPAPPGPAPPPSPRAHSLPAPRLSGLGLEQLVRPPPAPSCPAALSHRVPAAAAAASASLPPPLAAGGARRSEEGPTLNGSPWQQPSGGRSQPETQRAQRRAGKVTLQEGGGRADDGQCAPPNGGGELKQSSASANWKVGMSREGGGGG
ncbi:basic proline-rich protein-like [Sarcophilus harrisii]|uniref:basic proline-rich protein-like n=1 Tax=Sarcophilus harrisii TaxID=9305 RepID=UPI001301E52A|nr:basic proline-rich protein-like [Sarcophilus harrisii]